MDLRPKKAIVYDCDGVLFDSKPANEAFYNHILERFDMPPLRPDQLAFVHVSTAKEAVDFLFDSSPWKAEAQRYREIVDYHPFVPLMRLEPHVLEVLSQLRPAYHTAIATNRSYSMPIVLREHQLEDLFDLTITSLDVQKPKPHPECLWKILTYFQVDPDEVIYVGDAEVDRLVASGAGVPFAAYKNPELEAEFHFEDHLDLLDLLRVR